MSGRSASAWKTRLKAWWEGYDLPAGADASTEQRDVNEIRAEQIEQDLGNSVTWSLARIKVAQAVWGPEFHGPGDDDHISMLIKPFGLNESMSVMDIGAGLGGAARMIAKTTSAWVTGYESDQVLQRAGLARSIKAGMERKAPIQPLDWSDLTFDKRYDAILSREVFFTVPDKDGLIASLVATLKPRGHLMFTDYTLTHTGKPAAAITTWGDNEPIKPYPSTVTQTVERLQRVGLDVRTSEDITDKHHEMVLNCWDTLTRQLPAKAHDEPEIRDVVLDEAELWMRRMAAMETGDLRIFRFYALASG